MRFKAHSHAWPFWVALIGIVMAAAALRLYRLPDLPLGLHYDEAANLILAGEIARGEKTPAFIPSYTGKEVAFFYWAALWARLLGTTPLVLRLSAALVGLATVAVAVWVTRELLDGWPSVRWAALICGAFLAASFWHLVFSRYGFRAVTQPLLQGLTVGALWRGLRIRSAHTGQEADTGGRWYGWPWLVLAGVCCGLTAYTYLAARAFPLPLAAGLLAFLLMLPRGSRRARSLDGALVVVPAALALVPLLAYWLGHPGSFMTRTRQVAAADWSQAWAGIKACLAMLFMRGDPYIRFNLPLRPLLDPITAAFFLIGLIWVAWRAIRPPTATEPTRAALSRAGCVFLLVALPVMLLPSALAVGDITPSNLRAIGLLPFVYVFPAVGITGAVSWALQWLSRRRAAPAARPDATGPTAHTAYARDWPSVWQALAAMALVVLLSVPTATAYFRDWASSAALYYAADGDLVDVAAYLNQRSTADSRTTVYVASRHYRHPTLASLARDYSDLRWLVGGSTIVLPSEGDALLIFPHSAAKDLPWVETVLPNDLVTDTPAGPDGEPAFTVYRVPASFDAAPRRALSANLGGAVEVLGYDVLTVPAGGGDAEVVAWWHVAAQPEHGDYSPLVRLADRWGFVWGENDVFHYPSEQWQPGERVLDHISVPVDYGAPPGDYSLRFSIYSPQADHALPVLDEAGRYAGTWVELPVHLDPAAPPRDEPETAKVIRKLGIRQRYDAEAPGLTLLGANVDTAEARPGDPLYLTLFWQAQATTRPDYRISLWLGDRLLSSSGPVRGTYPFTEWYTGEIIADRYGLRLPRDLQAGAHTLALRLDTGTDGADPHLALDLSTLTVQAIERSFDVPLLAHRLTPPVALDGQVELLGYDLGPQPVAPGETLVLTLVWRALAEMEQDYTVFVHLLGPDSIPMGQRDAQPVAGTYPTTLWLPGEVVTDRYEIAVSPAAPSDGCWLEIGMYVAENGQRLSDLSTAQDAIRLGPVVVANP